MTEKQKLFCSYYIQTLNASESYRLAYPNASDRTAGENGFKLLKKTEIKDYIDEHMKTKVDDAIATEDEVLRTITEILRDKKARYNDRLKASELLGKRYGTFTEKIDIKSDNSVSIDFSTMTTEQIKELLGDED